LTEIYRVNSEGKKFRSREKIGFVHNCILGGSTLLKSKIFPF